MKMNKARRSGYLSFDICEVKRLSESDSPNAEAYGYLYQAVTTMPGTPKGIDDAYPQTAQETAHRFWTGLRAVTGISSGR